LAEKNNYGFSSGKWIAVDTVDYVIHESGTAVYDYFGELVGEFPTESEAVEMVRDVSKQYYEQ